MEQRPKLSADDRSNDACASELNQIKSFVFKTIVEYISTCTLSYMFCMFFRCGSTCYMLKIHKTNKLCSRMSGMI